jgi:hypothetical protein
MAASRPAAFLGKMAAVVGDGPVALVDLGTGRLLAHTKCAQARSVAFTPDGRRFAVGIAHGDGAVVVFDTPPSAPECRPS